MRNATTLVSLVILGFGLLPAAASAGMGAIPQSKKMLRKEQLKKFIKFQEKNPGAQCAEVSPKKGMVCTTADGKTKKFSLINNEVIAKQLAKNSKLAKAVSGSVANSDALFGSYLNSNASAVVTTAPTQAAFADAPIVVLPTSATPVSTSASGGISTSY